uniref:Uncharacterized protein n=1 Tax=Megaselia scalaris TaxID=36166 RepID=T1GGQ2_MEGSC
MKVNIECLHSVCKADARGSLFNKFNQILSYADDTDLIGRTIRDVRTAMEGLANESKKIIGIPNAFLGQNLNHEDTNQARKFYQNVNKERKILAQPTEGVFQ